MQRVILIFGLLAGVLISVFLVLALVMWEKSGRIINNELVGYATMVIAL